MVCSNLSLLAGGIAVISLVVSGIGSGADLRGRRTAGIGARRRSNLDPVRRRGRGAAARRGTDRLVLGMAASALITVIAVGLHRVGQDGALVLAFSLLVGVVFGVGPARTASQLRLVDASRYEKPVPISPTGRRQSGHRRCGDARDTDDSEAASADNCSSVSPSKR